MATKTKVFDVDTIKPRKGNELGITEYVSESGVTNLRMTAKTENPNYDKKAKTGPNQYQMSIMSGVFDFFLLKSDGSVSFKIKDNVSIGNGLIVNAYPSEFSKDEE
jgi:hypothetical protein